MNLDEEIHLPNYSKKIELKKTEMQMNPSVKGEKKIDLGATKFFF